MGTTLEHLIESAAAHLDAAEQPEAQDFCGFRQRAAEMTDLFIEALFPRHAAAPIRREDALRQAAELLDTCLRFVLPPSARPESVVRTMLETSPRSAASSVRIWKRHTAGIPPHAASTRSSSAIPPFSPSAPTVWPMCCIASASRPFRAS